MNDERQTNPAQDLEFFTNCFHSVETEVRSVVVGMSDVLRLTLAAIFAGGHVLLEGAPGLGKTLLVKSLAQALGLSFHRIQFTSDLMPSDITGTQVLTEDENARRSFIFKPGPVFANIVLADEVNRAGPKTQSALLEAMEEKQVSILGETHKLPEPFFVLATQNPVELEGTYPLPEAQLDRFLFKLHVNFPEPSELREILHRTTGSVTNVVRPILSPAETSAAILRMRRIVRSVAVAPQVEQVVLGMMYALTPQSSSSTDLVNQYVRFGPGPRGAQSLLLGAKVFALMDSRMNLSYEDVRQALIPALRHRLILNYQADADNVTADEIIEHARTNA